MKKIVVVMLLFAIFLSGCGESAPPSTPKPESSVESESNSKIESEPSPVSVDEYNADVGSSEEKSSESETDLAISTSENTRTDELTILSFIGLANQKHAEFNTRFSINEYSLNDYGMISENYGTILINISDPSDAVLKEIGINSPVGGEDLTGFFRSIVVYISVIEPNMEKEDIETLFGNLLTDAVAADPNDTGWSSESVETDNATLTLSVLNDEALSFYMKLK